VAFASFATNLTIDMSALTDAIRKASLSLEELAQGLSAMVASGPSLSDVSDTLSRND
jgi:hypothetical protein